MTSEQETYSYEPFTRHGFYREMNRKLVDRTVSALTPPIERRLGVVDVGCGTGAATELIVSALVEQGVDAEIVALEPSPEALASARARLADSPLTIHFVEGDVGDLGASTGPADVVFFCNAIHLVEDKDATIAQIAGALVPGGLAAFNSAFFSGAYAPGTEDFYRRWTIRAVRWLHSERPDVQLAHDSTVQAMNWFSPEDYQRMLRDNGFDVVWHDLDEARMTLASFQDIGQYWMFINGALPGAPLDAGAEALRHGAAEVFEQQGLSDVPRNWLQLLARRHDGQATTSAAGT